VAFGQRAPVTGTSTLHHYVVGGHHPIAPRRLDSTPTSAANEPERHRRNRRRLGAGKLVGQQRLGRAQDTPPTIIVHAGEACNVLVTAPIQLEAWPR
jgi:hypothetical protein